MKTPIFLLLCFYFSSSYAQQLPIVKAQATQKERYYDWMLERPKPDDEGTDFWVTGDCSEFVNSPQASSTLASQGKNSYQAKNIADDDPTTVWVEGKADYGIGEYIEFKTVFFYTCCILNGYQKDKNTWENNSRVKKLRVFIEGKPTFEVILEDKMGIQSFAFPEHLKIDPKKTEPGETKVKMQILEVYEGKKYKDVAISEIFFAGC
ncbi:MAG: hypothetical protein OHK0057_06240 [Thermoflexibacter sp.]